MASVSENINKINQLISENIDDLVFIINDKINCEYNNFEILTSKKHLNDFIHPKDSKRVIDFVKNIFQFGSGIEEARLTNHNKIFSWYEIKGTKFADDENIDKVFLLCRNISKLKSKEIEIKNYQKSYDQLAETLPEINYWKLLQSSESKTAIQRTREMLELVINNIPQLIYWKDKKLNYIGCNTRFAQINGFNRVSLIIGKSTEDLRWGRDKSDYIKQAESKVMENMEAEYNVVELLSKPNGILTWFEINRIPLHDIEGRVEGILVTYEDITERKTAEQKLQESEENYRNLVINLCDIILEVGAEGTVIYVSPQSYDIMGYHPTELIGRSAFKFILPEDVPELAEIILKGIQTKELISIPHYRLLHKEGQIIEASAQGKYVDVGGNERFIGAIRDITIQKQIEEKLKESEENYRTIFNASPDYIYVTDVQGNLLEANPSLLERVGSSLEELQQTNFVEYYAGDDLDGLMEIFKNLTLGKEIKGIEITAKNVRGEDFEYEVNAVPLKKDGVVTKILNLARDITDKKITEQKLKDSEIKYRHLFENSQYSIILVNRKGELIDCNPATEKIFERNVEDLLGKSFLDLDLSPKNILPLFRDRYQSILEGIISKPLEIQIIRSSDQRPIWISITDSLVEVAEETVFQVIIQDITEKKIAEQDLKNSQEELKVLNRELEQKIRERTKDLIESERQYRTTINSMIDPMHVVNQDLEIKLANKALFDWLKELNIDSHIV
ncbi:MAG: PAS domain S-box protein, partial [Promethearchaeota archaeon]